MSPHVTVSGWIAAVVSAARRRVRNGEVTERQLARRTGISQAHMHNVLKGARMPSPELADRLIGQLALSASELEET